MNLVIFKLSYKTIRSRSRADRNSDLRLVEPEPKELYSAPQQWFLLAWASYF
jgi:hypothetical protein